MDSNHVGFVSLTCGAATVADRLPPPARACVCARAWSAGRAGPSHLPTAPLLQAINAASALAPLVSLPAAPIPSMSLAGPWTEPWARLTMELNPSSKPCSSVYIKPSSSSLLSFQHPLALASSLSVCLCSNTREPQNRHCWTLNLLGGKGAPVVLPHFFSRTLVLHIILSIYPHSILDFVLRNRPIWSLNLFG